MGLVTLPGAEPRADAPSGAEARRLVRRSRVERGWRACSRGRCDVPTLTPGRKVWPEHEGAQ